ncbi:gliding motility-associated ABC transporter substrate-binding protein GldG [Roseivirga sp. BDSF3-8]|uniref:gliding motility-associated ABC transporter substrate-binding protein GldG n=1 Tax=Roseivirga sp. BDSF3-8 TaxID=3241598 RepID=UPI003531C042
MVNLDSKKTEDLLRFFVLFAALILANMLGDRFFFRADLTEEQRYTINEATKELLTSLEDPVYVEVYLEGEFPSGFQRLQRSIRETLEEFRAYAGDNIQFKFVDPNLAASASGRQEFYQRLARLGIQPTNLYDTEDGGRTEKLIFPGALVAYGGEETGVLLLKGNQGASPEERLNQSVEGLEYELATAIRKVTGGSKPRIGWLQGHGESDSISYQGVQEVLQEFYRLDKADLTESENLLGYDAIIMAKPRRAFNRDDRYKLDQYVMNGGNLLMFLDGLKVEEDSLNRESYLAFPQDLQLRNMLFRYGVRINEDLIQDLNAAPFPVVTGYMGNQPQIRLLPWPFYPLMNRYSNHPITRNLDAVLGRYVSSVDTVKAEGITKTPLIYTSQYTRVLPAPVEVSYNSMRRDMQPESFQDPAQPVAWLLEGPFTSSFRNRILPQVANSRSYRETGEPAKILVTSDGDLLASQLSPRTRQRVPLGVDPYTQTDFANDDFLLNALAYMLDEDGLIAARNKRISIRPLDAPEVEESALKWQLFNLLTPVIIVVLFGVIRYFYRRNKYATFK